MAEKLMTIEEIEQKMRELADELEKHKSARKGLTKAQIALWESLGGEVVDGVPQDAEGCTFEQACKWWLIGGEAKHESHTEFMRLKKYWNGYLMVFGEDDDEAQIVLKDCLSNYWILKADASILSVNA